MSNAPIALFTYNRPDHTRLTVEHLLRNPEAGACDLCVFSDAPRTREEREAVEEVRRYLKSVSGFRSIRVTARASNFGLSRSIIEGVGAVLDEHGKVIVVEDDLITSPFFLRYMNEALGKYESEEAVASVHGYVYPVRARLPEAFFLRGADCWGWATWRRGWRIFESDGGKLLGQLRARRLQHAFDFDDGYPYTRMLEDQVAGRNDSWGIRWHASAFLKNKLTLYPGRSLVRNIGNDSSGTHGRSTDCFDVALADRPIDLSDVPVAENRDAFRAFREFLLSTRPGLARRIGSGVKRLLGRPRRSPGRG